MTDLRTAAQQALEALETRGEHHPRVYAAITALRAALAEPVQEPVAKVELMPTGGNAGIATRIVEIDDHLRERLRPSQLLYTATPQRTAEPVQEQQCNPHPKAPHGFLRNASHTENRYVCECEGWEPYEAGYQAGMEAALRAQS